MHLSLRGKLEIEVDQFAKQAWHETERQPLQGRNIIGNDLTGLGRIAGEHLGFEIAGKHVSYKTSFTGFRCAREALNPNSAPRVGTRSVESTARSNTTFSRIPAPATSIQVVRESASPVR